ncbi:hypothetical protein [Anabaena azotica]|uniref:Uncharacterized protein n=1 Tax=Anabaena azotica FACHB-119 TaxID=947527 RepID=A0ABR8DHT9_9NOST|nr:hypothetical protein [Anabaena azotica]MBD2505656.1 hypothetical protein [Anabaena azotica FACHB-119]
MSYKLTITLLGIETPERDRLPNWLQQPLPQPCVALLVIGSSHRASDRFSRI